MKNVKKRSIISEINVTPLVDVILVLLIVFIITAPMILPSVDVDLPVVSTNSSSSNEEKEVVITITKAGEIFIQDTPTKLLSMVEELNKSFGKEKNVRIFIRGDKEAPYEAIVKSLATLKQSGFKKISLVTEN